MIDFDHVTKENKIIIQIDHKFLFIHINNQRFWIWKNKS